MRSDYIYADDKQHADGGGDDRASSPLNGRISAILSSLLISFRRRYRWYLPPALLWTMWSPNYVTGFIFGALVESFCSEQNARMMAMQSASDNANAILNDLSIEYNRVRQAAITQEITEVISGAKAQKKKQS